MTRLCRTGLVSLASLVLTASLPPARASVVRQLTDVKSSGFRFQAMDDAGASVFVASSTDQLGTNPGHVFQVFKFTAATGSGSQITSFPDGVSDSFFGLSVSDDGQWLAFISRGDLTGQNHDRSAELFVINADGSQLAQLTADPGPAAGAVRFVAMAGSGNRIAFVSNSDLTGANPDSHQQLFVINRDGTGLAQVTSSPGEEFTYITISDDGQRLAFTHDGDLTGGNPDENYELFAVNADGTGLRQLAASTSGDVEWPVLAGNGAKIAFQSTANLVGTNADGLYEVFIVNWDGTGLLQLTNSKDSFNFHHHSLYPAITDDALLVYFTSDQWTFTVNPDGSFELWKVNSNGTGKTLVTNSGLYGGNLIVSGSGNRLAFGNPGYTSESDELHVIDSNGLNLRKLTETTRITVEQPEITPDGSRIVFSSDADLTGSNPDRSAELFRMQADGSDALQITNDYPSYEPSIAGDGSTIVFSSIGNPTGGNPDGNVEIFRIQADGTGVQQLTSSTSGFSGGQIISSNGAKVVFHSVADLTGGNADASGEVFSMNADGSNLTQLTDGPGPGFSYYSYYPRVDGAGTWVVFSGNDDIDGGNPDHSFEVWRVRSDATGLQRLTTDPAQNSFYPDVSGDGTRIVFSSDANLTGSNADLNVEIFLYNTATASMQQLTDTLEGDSYYPRISEDGAYVYFISDAPFFEKILHGGYELFRVAVDTGQVTRADALGLGQGVYPYALGALSAAPAVDSDGRRVVFANPGNFTEENFDIDPEIWVVDLDRPAGIRPSGGPAPTIVSWDHESGPVRYDVIRGDLANVQQTGPGTVDLGPVVCVEDDSPDADTGGNEDPETPSPGQVFFYLYRGTQGLGAGPGSYGRASSGAERLASSGDCSG